MSTEHESMMGILKLYELRSEETMRKARDWFATVFHPESTQDILQALVGDHSADFRMVASYWDMAAAFVVFGAINDVMFNAINKSRSWCMPSFSHSLKRFARCRVFRRICP